MQRRRRRRAIDAGRASTRHRRRARMPATARRPFAQSCVGACASARNTGADCAATRTLRPECGNLDGVASAPRTRTATTIATARPATLPTRSCGCVADRVPRPNTRTVPAPASDHPAALNSAADERVAPKVVGLRRPGAAGEGGVRRQPLNPWLGAGVFGRASVFGPYSARAPGVGGWRRCTARSCATPAARRAWSRSSGCSASGETPASSSVHQARGRCCATPTSRDARAGQGRRFLLWQWYVMTRPAQVPAPGAPAAGPPPLQVFLDRPSDRRRARLRAMRTRLAPARSGPP